jgi:hypothetical protein
MEAWIRVMAAEMVTSGFTSFTEGELDSDKDEGWSLLLWNCWFTESKVCEQIIIRGCNKSNSGA